MARRDMVSLPPPFHTICVNAKQCGWGFHIEYLAPSLEVLRDAKCITRAQLNSLRKPSRGRSRTDSDGDSISVHRKPTKKSPSRVLVFIRVSSSDEKALALPGVRENCVDWRSARRNLREHSAPARDAQKTHLRMGATPNFRQMDRAIGRFQRPVQWTVIEDKLIVPNWQKVKTDWMLQRAIDNTLR